MDVAILLGLIALSAVISTAEIGFFAVNETKLRALAQGHNHRAKMALHLRSDPQKLLATILVGDRLVGTAIPMYATFLTLNTYGADRTFFDDTIAVVVGLLTGAVVSLILIYVVNRQSFHWSMDLAAPAGLLTSLSILLVVAAALIAVVSGRQAMSADVVKAVKEDW